MSAHDVHRIEKVLESGRARIHVLDHAILQAARDMQKAKHGKVLHIFAKTYATGKRAHRTSPPSEYREVLIHSSHAAAINLTDVDRLRLEEAV